MNFLVFTLTNDSVAGFSFTFSWPGGSIPVDAGSTESVTTAMDATFHLTFDSLPLSVKWDSATKQLIQVAPDNGWEGGASGFSCPVERVNPSFQASYPGAIPGEPAYGIILVGTVDAPVTKE